MNELLLSSLDNMFKECLSLLSRAICVVHISLDSNGNAEQCEPSAPRVRGFLEIFRLRELETQQGSYIEANGRVEIQHYPKGS